MIELTVAQIAEIVGGAVADISPQDAAHRRVTGTVEFDSRAIGPGGLFLALPGRAPTAPSRSRCSGRTRSAWLCATVGNNKNSWAATSKRFADPGPGDAPTSASRISGHIRAALAAL